MNKRKFEQNKNLACREFNDEWKERYMFALGRNGKPVCLVCGFSVSVVKKYNMERHFNSSHADLVDKYPIGSDLRREFIAKKEKGMNAQQSLFTKIHEQNKSMVVASYEVALLLAKKKKPFTDGEEIVKPVLEIAARMLGDKNIQAKFKDIPLSNNTMTRRIEELADNVSEQIAFHASNCKFFSLAMDESTDISDTAQVSIFIRAVSNTFEVIEELLGLESIQGTTKGTDLFRILKTCVEKNKLDWKRLDSICTDGAPALTGRHVGCLSLLEKFLARPLLKYHCIIHQESLCGKAMNMNHVMDVVVKCVNKIRAKSLNRREFRQFISELDAEYGELLLHCEVRWLSKGKVLSRFWDLKRSILEFLTEINELPIEREYLANNEWLNDLAFLVDITGHLNNLNLKLQASNNLFANLCNCVASFKMKLQLFVIQLSEKKFDNFQHLKERMTDNDFDEDKYRSTVVELLTAFQSRFSEFADQTDNVALFTNPFNFPDERINCLDENLQLEIIDLKCNSVFKSRFAELPVIPTADDMISFWCLLPESGFEHLRSFAQRYVCRFGSTYRCEQSFSAMKLIKSKNRSRLTDSNLNGLMILATTKLQPDIEKLASNIQPQNSH